jgi:hypothetical protein
VRNEARLLVPLVGCLHRHGQVWPASQSSTWWVQRGGVGVDQDLASGPDHRPVRRQLAQRVADDRDVVDGAVLLPALPGFNAIANGPPGPRPRRG